MAWRARLATTGAEKMMETVNGDSYLADHNNNNYKAHLSWNYIDIRDSLVSQLEDQ